MAGLLPGLGDVPAHQHPPVAAINGGAVSSGGLFGEPPLRRQRLQPVEARGCDGQHTGAVLAGQLHATGADARRSGHRHALLDRKDLQGRLVECEPVALVGESFLAVEQADDHAHCFVLSIPEQHRADAHRAGVARQRAGAAAEHRPALRHVVELDQSLGDVERVVVRQRHHTRTEHDRVRDLPGGGEEHLR